MTGMMFRTKVFFRAIGRGFKYFKILAFGKYINSGWDGQSHYHLYEYKGKEYRYDYIDPCEKFDDSEKI